MPLLVFWSVCRSSGHSSCCAGDSLFLRYTAVHISCKINYKLIAGDATSDVVLSVGIVASESVDGDNLIATFASVASTWYLSCEQVC